MPWSSLTNQIADGGGFWTFLGVVITAASFVALGLVKTLFNHRESRDTDLTSREQNLVLHLVTEVGRLNTLVLDLDAAFKGQAEMHRLEMQRERDECNAKIVGLQVEIDLLRQRITREEHR
jgi:hypothetical protein